MTVGARKIDEALAFFQLFERGPWNSCHVRTGDLDLFVSRDASHLNPAFAHEMALGPTPVETVGEVLTAPHVGTVVELAPLGASLDAGQTYAVLALLDERIELVADRAGIVVDHLHPIVGLIEYDQPLIRFQ